MKAICNNPSAMRAAIASASVIATAILAAPLVQAGPPIGLGVGEVNDWSGEVVFADAMKQSRQWSTTNLDANGWPQQDAGIYVWADTAANFDTSGTYALSFDGQADVTGAAISGLSYDSGTNRTTATLTLGPTSTLYLSFTNTRRTPDSALNTGVTNVQLMRPIAVGAGAAYSVDTMFTVQAKALYAKFDVLRFMDWLNTNGNPSVDWSDRTRPDWATQFRWNGEIWNSRPMGAAWEYAVQLCNETGTDMWINLPVGATDDYVAKVAQLIAYGSDGELPYTSAQANPRFAPLDPGLRVYVEFCNEVWNTAGFFPQSQTNKDAAVAEVIAGGSPLNFDGASGEWDWAARRSAKRTVEISTIFRGVFGDAAMMTRVRPVLESQQGYTGWWAYQQSRMMEDYYNSAAQVATPRSPSYYVYGAGGSAYYGPENDDATLTLDSIWTSKTNDVATWIPICRTESAYAVSLYGHRVAYEGGPSMDVCGCASDAVKSAAWNDPRMTTSMLDHQTVWQQTGGDLLVYFTAVHDYQWGFTRNVYTLDTPKLEAIDQISASVAALGTSGTPIPGTVAGDSFLAPETWGVNRNALSAAGALGSTWLGYLVRNSIAGEYSIALNAGSVGAGNQADLYLDGVLIGTISIPSTGGNTTPVTTAVVAIADLSAGTHGLKVKARAGVFGVQSIVVMSGSASDLPGAPGTLIANGGNAKVTLSWGAASNATSYDVYRGAVSGGQSTTPIATNITTNSYVDEGLANGTTYFYTVAGVNASGIGPQSNEASAAPVPAGIGPQVITSIRFYPRAGEFGWRMQGGLFQGSNDGANWTTIDSLVDVWPPNDTWTTRAVSSTAPWRYVRFLSNASGGYALNVAELEFYNGTTKLVGLGIGTPGSYQNDPSRTFDKALDGDITTFVDNSGGSFVGYDFGPGAEVDVPEAPTELTVTAGSAQVVLTWVGSATATSYNVYRATSTGGQGTTPVASGLTTTSYTDGDLTNGTTYYYTVAGVNGAGAGPQSGEVSATPSAAGIGPQVVTSIRFYPRPGEFGWRMQGGSFEGSSDGANWSTIDSLVNVWPPNDTWTTRTVTDPTPWRYVRFVSNTSAGYALNIAEVEFYSGTTKLLGLGIGTPGSYQNDPSHTFDKALDGDITTFVDNSGGSFVGYDFGPGSAGALPEAPTDLTADAGNAQVALAWTASASAVSYNIYRGTSAGAQDPAPVATGVTAVDYVDASLTNGTTYYYTVAGVNAAGIGPRSNETFATPVQPNIAPTITLQPGGQTATVGDSVTFTVQASGYPAPAYQWRKNGSPISGNSSATSATLALTSITTADAGRYDVVVTNLAGIVESDGATLIVNKAAAVVLLSNFEQRYDGTPCAVTIATLPAGLPVTVTYNDSASAPIYPGAYAVVATIDDLDFAGAAEDTLVVTTTALVRHAPALNGGLDGSVQVLLPESTTLNSSAWISGDLLVAGKPAVRLNGSPTYGGTIDATGLATPTNHKVTLNSGAVLRHVVRRVNAIPMPAVVAPPPPSGTRNITLNHASQSPGDFTTLRNLTLNGKAGQRTIPPGTYGTFVANGNSGFVFGIADAVEPAVYHLQRLTLNSSAQLQIVGPVFLTLASGVTLNGSVGSTNPPEWLELNVASGGVTLNGSVTLAGAVTAPNGTITINCGATLNGGTASDRLVINGNGLLQDGPAPGSVPAAPDSFTASASDGAVMLSWDAVSGASTYSLFRGTGPSGAGAIVIASEFTGTSYTDTAASNGTTYYYWLTGVNANGTGVLSSAVSATPAPPPTMIGTNFWNKNWGTGPSDYFQPDLDWATTTNPWRADFLDEVSVYAVIRFMDWVPTNSSTAKTWSQRVPKTANHYTSEGVAYEWQIDLCNRVGADLWITVPHLTIEDYEASPGQNYWTELASLIKNSLDPGLNVWLEYSNESWSGGPFFNQGDYTGQRGVAMGFDPDAYSAKFQFHVYAATRLHQVFLDAFAGQTHRLKKVIAGQANSIWGDDRNWGAFMSISALNNPAINVFGLVPDYYTVASYVGGSLDGGSANLAAEWSASVLTANDLAQRVKNTFAQYYATRPDLPLIAYEGGAHITNNAHLFRQNPASYTMYKTWLNSTEGVFDLVMHYTHVGTWSSGGAWGAKATTSQSVNDAHSYRALVDYIATGD